MSLKAHILLTSAFLLAMAAMLYATGELQSEESKQKAAAVAAEAQESFIQIVDATWGENCNVYTESLRSAPGEAQKNPDTVTRNNALRAVSKLCNGHDTCAFQVTPENMGK